MFPIDIFTQAFSSLPPLPLLASRALPLLPVIFSSNVLAISTEWYCHLEPLPRLKSPITGKTLSEIFRRSYTNGAVTFLANIFASIGTSGYLWLALRPAGEQAFFGTSWFRQTLALSPTISSSSLLHTTSSNLTLTSHPLLDLSSLTSPTLPLRRSLYLLTCIFGILHMFPFGAIVAPHVLNASRDRRKTAEGEERFKTEQELKEALKSWLKVNRVRIWTDVGAAVCAVLALVV